MRKRNDDNGYGLFRHLQLIETESEERSPNAPVPMPSRRLSRTPPKAAPRIRFEREVRIAPALDSSPVNHSGLAGQRELTSIGDERALFDRLAGICEKIASGYYNRPEVLDAVARRMVASGELENSYNGN